MAQDYDNMEKSLWADHAVDPSDVQHLEELHITDAKAQNIGTFEQMLSK